MPVTQSAKKALRQNKKRWLINTRRKRNLRDLIKSFTKSVQGKQIEEAKETLKKIYKELDKSAKLGIIKKENASRKKGRLTSLLNKTQKLES